MNLLGVHRKTDSRGYCRRTNPPIGQLEQRVGNAIPASPIITGLAVVALGAVLWHNLGSRQDEIHDSASKPTQNLISTDQQPDLFSIADIEEDKEPKDAELEEDKPEF